MSPNPIKEYYIGYFDILGYKAFFELQSNKIPELLVLINDAIQRTNSTIRTINHSPIIGGIGNIDIHIKVFSDNILLCMEVSKEVDETVRLLAFLKLVADIQKGFVTEYGLFIRGGILKGQISFNDDYVFGQGLIDVVAMEECAQYPRIVIDNDLIEYLQNGRLYTQDELVRKADIEKQLNDKKIITFEEQQFYSQISLREKMLPIIRLITTLLTMQWADGKWILCYLNMISSSLLFNQETIEYYTQMIQKVSPYDYQFLNQPVQTIDDMLYLHKNKVEEQLKKYGNNLDIPTGEVKNAEIREKVLRKYIWVMAFHNRVCEVYQKPEHKILTNCNCDSRFLKMIVEVINPND